jgi:hypothetical protein
MRVPIQIVALHLRECQILNFVHNRPVHMQLQSRLLLRRRFVIVLRNLALCELLGNDRQALPCDPCTKLWFFP